MENYNSINALNVEIEQLKQIYSQLETDLNHCRSKETQETIKKMVVKLKHARNDLIRKYNCIVMELEQIRSEDEEVYFFIYWHCVKGLSWHQTFNKVCPGLIYADPACYCKKRVSRYLEKRYK